MTTEMLSDARITATATSAAEREVADAPEEDVVTRDVEDPREAALDDADAAGCRPEHREQGDREQQRRVVAGADDEVPDVAVDRFGQEAVELVGDGDRRARRP